MDSFQDELAWHERSRASLRRSQRRRERAFRERIRRIRTRGGSASLITVALIVAVAGGGVAVGQSAGLGGGGGSALLKRGAGGPGVAAMQRALGVPADGVFGPATAGAVRAFQSRKGLVVDGIVGPQTRGALGLAAAPAAAAPPRGSTTQPQVSAGAPSGSLQRIAQCESGGNPRAVGGGGRYRGKYQFSYSTWRGVGGSGDPAAATEAEQDRRAAMLMQRGGSGQWPVCGR
jgi:hypothetical protein